MTMQRRPINSIEQRKLEVRKYSRNAVVSIAGGVVGGIALALIAESATWLLIGLVIAVVGGWVNWSKVQK
ncbi:hypothetical protein CIP107558_01555 [Corynebacterium diphtheriae]|nr:hypothetical protein CIP107558_01555 [Corynebacterium diphtheriae]